MSAEKAEVKMGTAHQIGCDLDDMLHAAEEEVAASKGGQTAIVQVQKGIGSIMAQVKKEMDDGKYPIEVANELSKLITRVQTSVGSIGTLMKTREIQALGKVDAYKKAVEVTKKVYDTEARKKDAGNEAREGARPVGSHPGPGIRARREAEVTEEEDAPPNGRRRRRPRGMTDGADTGQTTG